jgi:hypothetical protein
LVPSGRELADEASGVFVSRCERSRRIGHPGQRAFQHGKTREFAADSKRDAIANSTWLNEGASRTGTKPVATDFLAPFANLAAGSLTSSVADVRRLSSARQ